MSKPVIDTKRVAPSHDSNQANPKPINSPKEAHNAGKGKGK